MQLPSVKRLVKTDFDQTYQDFVDKLAFVLNSDIESLFNAMNNNISLNDNVNCAVKDFTVKVNATGTPINGINLPLSLTSKILGVTVLMANNLDNAGVYPTSAVFLSWSQNSNNIIINNITGLQPNTNYQIRFVAYAT